jgi:predicted nuclease of predicted toxin-antitoxin system
MSPTCSTSAWGEADDETILARALVEERAVVTADTDFVTMLALTGAELPSVVLVRRDTGRRVAALASLLVANVAPSTPRSARAAS